MNTDVAVWSIVILTATLATAGVLAGGCLRAALAAPTSGRTARWILLAGLALTGWGLFRPHQHVFQGLDCSAYRLMTRAFMDGRGFHATDRVLAAVPRALRRGVLLSDRDEIRATRDRSFQLRSVDTCATQPYFYPTLPLAAAGLAEIAGQPSAADLFMPLLGWLAAAALMGVGIARAGWAGGVLAIALCLGSPLAGWTLRGYFAEAAGGVLVALALAHAALPGGRLAAVEALACGLAVSFHPALLPLALPAAGLAALGVMVPAATGRRGALISLRVAGAFAMGLVPLVCFTLAVAQPYGGFGLQRQVAMVRAQPILGAAYAISAILGVGLLAASGAGRRGRTWLLGLASRDGGWVRLALPLAALLPGLLLSTLWSRGAWVQKGAQSWIGVVGWPFGLLLAGALFAAALRGTLRSRLLACGVMAVAPFYLALKGFEPVGFWSLRRLCPLLLAVLPVALATLAAGVVALRAGRWRIAAAAAVAAACLWLPLRVPQAYTLREELGADGVAGQLAAALQDRLVLCDYYPHSVPLAFEPGVRALGANRAADWDALVAWSVAQQTSGVAVAWLTSYAPPGLELGLRLVPRQRVAMALPRLVSRRDRLASAETWRMQATVLAPEPARADAPPVLDKTLDGGRLALRGEWDGRVVPSDGGRPAGQWCAPGSAWVGPVPLPGQTVRLRLTGSVATPGARCALQVRAPWGGAAAQLVFGRHGVITNTLEWLRPPDDPARLGATGVYRVESAEADSGATRVLLHHIRMEVGASPGAAR